MKRCTKVVNSIYLQTVLKNNSDIWQSSEYAYDKGTSILLLFKLTTESLLFISTS